ncbi:hypothetical protein [Streptomyces sp. 2131.1]|uniref:hypothetical protein n=1 Tax=Streptomyces sp. 2131.1 TaxID=1855346 RepID=UPI002108ED72|nr:hypothetical protein [Streptomyces sp. 2131.1]
MVHLDPAAAVFEARKNGWTRQQAARFLRARTIDPRAASGQRLEEFTDLYPWQWTPAEGEAFIAHLRSGTQPIQMSTVRTYEVTIPQQPLNTSRGAAGGREPAGRQR